MPRPALLRAVLLSFLAALPVTGVPLPAQATRWTVGTTPTLRLGHDPDDTVATFAVIEYATRLADGSIIVGDRADFALKRFSPEGTLLQRAARKGTGPGEIDYLGHMWRCGDSLYTYDIEGYRQQVFDLSLRYVRLFRFGSVSGNTPYHSACNAQARFVHFGWETRSDMKGGIYRPRVPLWTSDASDRVGPILDSLPGSERWGQVIEGQLRGSRPLPLGKQPVVGIGRTRLYVGSADRFELRALDLDGRPVAMLRRSEPAVETTQDDIRAYVELRIAEVGEHRRASIERTYAEIEFPKTLPAYTDLVIDSEDLAWVRHFPRHDAVVAKWTVFSAVGAIVAEVDVPRYLTVFEIGRDYVLGRYLDPEEAMPEVRLYRLTR